MSNLICIEAGRFVPDTLTCHPGAVEFHNNDAIAHTVTWDSGPEYFDAGSVPSGCKCTVQVPKAGEYHFHTGNFNGVLIAADKQHADAKYSQISAADRKAQADAAKARDDYSKKAVDMGKPGWWANEEAAHADRLKHEKAAADAADAKAKQDKH